MCLSLLLRLYAFPMCTCLCMCVMCHVYVYAYVYVYHMYEDIYIYKYIYMQMYVENRTSLRRHFSSRSNRKLKSKSISSSPRRWRRKIGPSRERWAPYIILQDNIYSYYYYYCITHNFPLIICISLICFQI